MNIHRPLLAIGLAGVSVMLAACGDDNDGATAQAAAPATTAPAAPTTPTSTPSTSAPSTLTIEATDFSFGELPDIVPSGTRLELTNASSVEVHEAVAFRLPAGDARPLDEVLAEMSDPTALGEFVGVAVALPGEQAVYPEGPVVLDAPGRYLIVCFVPTGADPAVYAEAFETGVAPTGLTGEPHLAHGMFDEVTVR